MKILHALVDSLPQPDTPVRAVFTGAFWTLVTSRFTGMATTYREQDLQHSDQPGVVKDAGRLEGKRAAELVAYAFSENTVSASIGLAAINSLLDVDETRCTAQGAFEILAEKGRGRDVAVVGHFPFIPKLREVARNVWVLEKRLRPGDFQDTEAAAILPKAEVVCLTGTAFINHTLEDLLACCRDAFVVLTGPSAPLAPVLFEQGIDAICGTRVVDAAEVVRYISQGACFKQIRGHGVRLLTMTRTGPAS